MQNRQHFMTIGNGIDLDRCNFRGCFWKLTGHTYSSLRELQERDQYYVSWKGSGGNQKMKLKSINRVVHGKIGESCIEFILYEDKYGLQMRLSHLTTNCSFNFVPESKVSKTKTLLDTLEHVAFMFGVQKISLEDAAYPYPYEDIDLSLLTVMKKGETFYETYGYRICETISPDSPIKAIDLTVHKRLLKEFRMDIFIQCLREADKHFVHNLLNKLNTKFERLDQFYTAAYEYYSNKDNVKKYHPKKLRLQALLTDDKYPWYAMIHILQTTKYCMEMYIDDI